MTHFLHDENATLAFGASLAPALESPLIVYLEGGLGAGKTTLVRGLLRQIGYQGAVKSPTYALVESYPFEQYIIHHFDLYRFTDPSEWQEAGLDEFSDGNQICLIEWAQQGEDYVPEPDITISLNYNHSSRIASVFAHTNIGNRVLTTWKNNLPAAN